VTLTITWLFNSITCFSSFLKFWVFLLFTSPCLHPLDPSVWKHHFHSSLSLWFSVLSLPCWVLVACIPHPCCCGLFYPIRSPLCLLPAAGLCRLFMTVRYWQSPLPPTYSLSHLLLALMPNGFFAIMHFMFTAYHFALYFLLPKSLLIWCYRS